MPAAQEAVEAALAGVRQELINHHSGSPTVGWPVQLQAFEENLERMLDDLQHGRFDEKRTGMAHAAVDSWPPNHELTGVVAGAEHAYVRAAERQVREQRKARA